MKQVEDDTPEFSDRSHITTKARETPLNSELLGSGTIIKSTTGRQTEIDGLKAYEDGQAIEASDTQGEWRDAGLAQCKRCGIAQDIETAFRKMLKNGKAYQYSICRDCEIDMARTRRFSRVIAQSPYPKRIDDK